MLRLRLCYSLAWRSEKADCTQSNIEKRAAGNDDCAKLNKGRVRHVAYWGNDPVRRIASQSGR